MKKIEIILQDNFAVNEATEFREQVNELIAKGERNFIINFTKCNFIDSTGLGVLVGIYKNCAEIGGSIEIYSIQNPHVRKIFKLTRLDKVFQIHD